MTALPDVDLIRISASESIDPTKKGSLGQFFTSQPISKYMASLFDSYKGHIQLLDPGCGPGSLTAAFIDEAVKRGETKSIEAKVIDIEDSITPYILETIEVCEATANKNSIKAKLSFQKKDYVLATAEESGLFSDSTFSHCIMNPPYKKIASSSNHRKALSSAGIETVNLYSGFVSLAIQQLKEKGELVAIIPRSFCNGPYYTPFREQILRETAVKHIHIFDSRSNAFSDDKVLQENIIIHLVKGAKQNEVTITSSPNADFHIDEESSTITASDMTIRTIPFHKIVNPDDKDKFFHIAANNRDQAIIDRLSIFNSSLKDIEIEVSTGPVVDFRLKDDLRADIEENAVPLIYPIHLNGQVNWPKESKKPNAIKVTDASEPWLWKHEGSFVIVRRFSSKEEKRRIVATAYDSHLPGKMIGFENKLNVFHSKKVGMNQSVALGLYAYLNSTLLDKYYRIFGGHTQVNATDLRNIHYPNIESLKRIGEQIESTPIDQNKIDTLIDKEIFLMTGNNDNPLNAQEKIQQAIDILALLGMPRAQQNERSALTLLALLDLKPNQTWQEVQRPMMGVTPIMSWAKDHYGKEYAPNTRETFRRQTLHQFTAGAICLYNPDEPNRPVNSPKACYQITEEVINLLNTFGTKDWDTALREFTGQSHSLASSYAMPRDMNMIPLTLDDGSEIKLSPGEHSQLIRDIVADFGPRFAPGSEVIYLGDTGAKNDFFKEKRLTELGITVDKKGKLPDVILYWPEKDWLLLIESVTSHGPVDGKRHQELKKLFSNSKTAGPVYVTAVPNKAILKRFITEISWETEVWVADNPSHMIHFNGDRFLGPH